MSAPNNAERRTSARECIDAVRPLIDPAGVDDDAGVVGDLLANLAHLYGAARFRRMADNAIGHAEAEGGKP